MNLLTGEPAPLPLMGRTAAFDGTHRYRYSLGRCWEPEKPRVCWIMLNPSTADHLKDDPTIRKCIAYSRSWGYGSMVVVNLFAFRATNPKDLKGVPDPCGKDNDQHILAALLTSSRVIAAWGVHGSYSLSRVYEVRCMVRRRAGVPLYHLGLTRGGHPRHPLYLPGTVTPARWESGYFPGAVAGGSPR